jgi:hypothetical protein
VDVWLGWADAGRTATRTRAAATMARRLIGR